VWRLDDSPPLQVRLPRARRRLRLQRHLLLIGPGR
jgi:hypothetical protein